MMVTTAKGTKIPGVNLCSLSTITGALIIYVESVDNVRMPELLFLLGNPEETGRLTMQNEKGETEVFEGYTDMMNMNFDATKQTLTVFLSRG